MLNYNEVIKLLFIMAKHGLVRDDTFQEFECQT